MKYYSTQRPVAPGTYPKYQSNTVTDIENYGERKMVMAIGEDGPHIIEAYGSVTYEKPISRMDADAYELVPSRKG